EDTARPWKRLWAAYASFFLLSVPILGAGTLPERGAPLGDALNAPGRWLTTPFQHTAEALGINVRRIFTQVFALGVGLAALGGVIAGPSMGLSLAMGESLLINALIALAIGGLTSFPGAAAGSLMVGIIQQFMIKYGQLGISIPGLAEPFKPTPPLVPASTVLLMVIVLLVLPHGLFGKKE
ncbi:MAG: hypothetical protein HUU38_23220, partial [Anaerolineales bacterium]|nr:hypothetical protein [Anaerolineales bacterium]